MRPRTPQPGGTVLEALCQRLAPGTAPQWLRLERSAGAVALDCFESVRRHVEAHGGESVFGWQLWEWPRLFLEAEFHAVWRDPAGNLRDITPKLKRVDGILFLPDPARRFEGRRINNVRMALTPAPQVAEFLRALDEEWQLLYRGERAAMKEFTLSGAEALQIAEIHARKRRYGLALGFR